MPIYHHFYVERRGDEGWIVPPGFTSEPWTFKDDKHGGFAWAHPRSGWLALFHGPEALFPLKPGPPDDRGNSVLLAYLDHNFGTDEELQLCWLPYPELFIDCWDTDLVLVSAKVPARYARLFRDGYQRFPRSELLAAGAAEDFETDLDVRLISDPIDFQFGKMRFEFSRHDPDRVFEVTWRATIAEFIGEPRARLFKELRQYGPDEDLRIISRRG